MDQFSFTASFLNRKGGVGKTSSVFHLAGELRRCVGKRVLVCDLDPQASLSQGFFGPAIRRVAPARRPTVAALFDDAYDPDPDELIHPTAFENISIVPATQRPDRPQHAAARGRPRTRRRSATSSTR